MHIVSKGISFSRHLTNYFFTSSISLSGFEKIKIVPITIKIATKIRGNTFPTSDKNPIGMTEYMIKRSIIPIAMNSKPQIVELFMVLIMRKRIYIYEF